MRLNFTFSRKNITGLFLIKLLKKKSEKTHLEAGSQVVHLPPDRESADQAALFAARRPVLRQTIFLGGRGVARLFLFYKGTKTRGRGQQISCPLKYNFLLTK